MYDLALNRANFFLMFIMGCLSFQPAEAQNQADIIKKGFNLQNAIIPIKNIKDGGPPRDGIPSIDQPKFLPVNKASYLTDTDRVLGVIYNGIQKAYPIKILNFHEIVNDQFGEHPVVITFCPLCGSGMAFEAHIAGSPKTFGVSGLLYNSDVLLYDRQTESLWSQIRGEAIAGPLVNIRLEMISIQLVTWVEWKKNFPFSQVLSTETGYQRDYSKDPYPYYYESENVWFPVENESDLYHPKTKILGIQVNGKYKAYPFPELEKKGELLVDNFNGAEIQIQFNKTDQTAILVSPLNNKISATTLFWFAWIAFFPETEVYHYTKKKN